MAVSVQIAELETLGMALGSALRSVEAPIANGARSARTTPPRNATETSQGDKLQCILVEYRSDKVFSFRFVFFSSLFFFIVAVKKNAVRDVRTRLTTQDREGWAQSDRVRVSIVRCECDHIVIDHCPDYELFVRLECFFIL